MPRKEKPDRARPAAQSSAKGNRYGRWRESVKDLLLARWHSADDVSEVAATVVGMFDAGARDVEVAAYLHSQELLFDKPVLLTDEARMALVGDLHRSAGTRDSERPSNDEL